MVHLKCLEGYLIFLEHPIFTVTASVLAGILVLIIGFYDARLGEILGMQMVFPIVVFGIMVGLGLLIGIGRKLRKKIKKRKTD